MLVLAVFFLIPGVIYSFPSCKNNLFIPFLRPAWDGSHFPHSLCFYHNCLPTCVLCLSYRAFLLQKAARPFSPAAEKWWSVHKSLCVGLITILPTNFRKAECPNLSWVIWELLYSSACLQSVEIDDCMLCAPTSTHLLPLTHPGPCRLCQPSPSAEGAAGTSRVSAAARLLTVPGHGQTVLLYQSRLGMDGQENPLSLKIALKPRDKSVRGGGVFIGWPSKAQPHGGHKSWSWRVGWLCPPGKLPALP